MKIFLILLIAHQVGGVTGPLSMKACRHEATRLQGLFKSGLADPLITSEDRKRLRLWKFKCIYKDITPKLGDKS